MDELTPIIIENATPTLITGSGAVEQGTKLATELAKIIESQKLYAVIQGRKFVTAEGWGTLGALVGCFPEVTRCVKLERSGEVAYEAEVVIRDTNNRLVSRGMAICSNLERSKKGFEEYAVMSMAQTRATGKAFRICFSWIVKLAGYDATPAEEVTPEMVKASAFCLRCKKNKKATPISAEQACDSIEEFTFPMCAECVAVGREHAAPKPYNRDIEDELESPDTLDGVNIDKIINDDFSDDIGEIKPPDFLAPIEESAAVKAMKAGMANPPYSIADTFPPPYAESKAEPKIGDSCWKHGKQLTKTKDGTRVFCATKLPDGKWCQSWKERPPAQMLKA